MAQLSAGQRGKEGEETQITALCWAKRTRGLPLPLLPDRERKPGTKNFPLERECLVGSLPFLGGFWGPLGGCPAAGWLRVHLLAPMCPDLWSSPRSSSD